MSRFEFTCVYSFNGEPDEQRSNNDTSRNEPEFTNVTSNSFQFLLQRGSFVLLIDFLLNPAYTTLFSYYDYQELTGTFLYLGTTHQTTTGHSMTVMHFEGTPVILFEFLHAYREGVLLDKV